MNTTNNTESTVPNPPLSKTPVFPPLSTDGRGGATIAILTAVVIVLCAMVFCSPEDLWNAGWHVGYYGSILLWFALAVFTFSLFSAACPIVVGYSVKELVARVPSLLALPTPKRPELNPGLSIAPDELIRFDSPEESPATFKAKGLAFLHIQNREIWGLAVGFRQRRALVIRSDGTTIEYDRNAPPWLDKEDWTPARNYKNETWAEYDADLEQDKRGYLAWVVGAKTEHADGIQKPAAFFEAFTSVFLPLLFVFLSAFTLNAQPKSTQVAQYVGPENFQKTKVTGTVVFRFQKLPIERTANAQTLAQILSDARTYSDEDNAGKLQEITLNGFPIPRNMQRAEIHAEVKEMPDTRTATRAEIAKFMRPAQRDTIAQASASNGPTLTLDSAAMADRMNATRTAVTASKGKLWGMAMSAWDTVLWIVETFFYALIWFAGLSRFTAVACNNETRITAWGASVYGDWIRSLGGLATVLTFFTALSLMLVFLTAVFIRAMTGQLLGLIELFLWDSRAYFTYGWLFVLWMAIKAIDKWVPNPKIMGHRGNNGPGLNRGS